MPKPEDLTLYHMADCPFCQRVHQALNDLGLTIALRDIRQNAQDRDDLANATNRQTVPCLRICDNGDVRWMHESLDIVAYLRKHFAS